MVDQLHTRARHEKKKNGGEYVAYKNGVYFFLGWGNSSSSKQQYLFICLLTAFKPECQVTFLDWSGIVSFFFFRGLISSMVSRLVMIYIYQPGLVKQDTACSTLGIPNTYI